MANNKRRRQRQDEAAASPKPKKDREEPVEDWIDALAKKASSTEHVVSKVERIGRRLAKKRRRDERNPVSLSSPKDESYEKETGIVSGHNMENDLISQTRLRILADRLRIYQQRSSNGKPSRSQASPRCDYQSKKNSKTKWNENGIQPRRNDYGGIGLARPSLFLPLDDPSFIPKVEEEFAEHVPGFFGKQRTKAMKKQLNGQMLWRQLKEKRIDNSKVGGKKLAGMSPDERVEALLKAGVI